MHWVECFYEIISLTWKNYNVVSTEHNELYLLTYPIHPREGNTQQKTISILYKEIGFNYFRLSLVVLLLTQWWRAIPLHAVVPSPFIPDLRSRGCSSGGNSRKW